MRIKDGMVFGGDGRFFQGDVCTDGEVFAQMPFGKAADAAGEEILDASGLYVIPGLVDIHLHGCAGRDVCDGTSEALDGIAAYEAGRGITSCFPATMTLPEEELERIFSCAGAYQNETGSRLLGFTMEGPFVSASKRGAQNAAYIRRPDIGLFQKLQRLCGGRIAQVAVAPEEDADDAFIRAAGKETVVSLAHTAADYETARRAFAAGASHVTHLFNAMPPFLHRDPGVVGAALDTPGVYAELICDGVHVHPSVVRAAFAMFGAERICMISDSMRAAGMPDGQYTLGGQDVAVRAPYAALADGTIAGSVTDLMGCLRTAVKKMGIPLEDAILSCTATPARSLGFFDRCGSIAAGKTADVVLLDKELEIVQVICRGKCLRDGPGTVLPRVR